MMKLVKYSLAGDAEDLVDDGDAEIYHNHILEKNNMEELVVEEG